MTDNFIVGFTGAYDDPVTGSYALGNGYRFHVPKLFRFAQPDHLSPFGAGGLNSYAYCACDPINQIDPSGHFHLSWQAWLGIAGAAIGVGLGISAGVGVASISAREDRALGEDMSADGRRTATTSGPVLSRGQRSGLPDTTPPSSAHPGQHSSWGEMIAAKRTDILHSVRIAESDEIVKTLEGDVVARSGDRIVTRLTADRNQAESWPVRPNKFEEKYSFHGPTGYWTAKPDRLVTVEQMPRPFEVHVNWGDPIKGVAGDFKVTYGPDDFGVIREDIFWETYGIRF